MRMVISTIIVGIVLFLLGGLIFGFLLAGFYKANFGPIMRPETDFKMWAFAVGSLARAFFMYLIYTKGYQGGSPFMEGLKYGVLIGLFFAIPYIFFTWGGSPVRYQPVIIDGIINWGMIVIAGILTGIIHGKKDVKPATV